jgi:hypothetical protein
MMSGHAGRIMNQLTGGYAVGVAGLVCFLPAQLCTPLTASRIGQLQVRLVGRQGRQLDGAAPGP